MYWQYLIGVIVGCIVTGIIFRIRHPMLGRLEVDESDPENVKWKFVLTKEIEFSKVDYIYLKVDNKTQISQK